MNQFDRDREDRAFEALILAQLRRERNCHDLNDLPELNDDERRSMKALPSDLIESLWEQAELSDEELPETELSGATSVDEDLFVGMNRADGPTDETKEQLDAARKEVLEQLKALKKDGKAGGDAKC